MRRSRRGILVLSAACLVGIAGCGSSGGSAGAGGNGGEQVSPSQQATASQRGPDHGWSQTNVTVDKSALACSKKTPEQTRGITDTTVKIGSLMTSSSPSGSAFADAYAGAKARFAVANAAGGVNGRTIELQNNRDDGDQPARTADLARAIVQQDKPFAAIALTTGPNYLDTFCDAQLPFFGWGSTPAYCGNLIGFAIDGCQGNPNKSQRPVSTGLTSLSANLLKPGVSRTAAVVGLDNEAAKQGVISIVAGFRAAGINPVYAKNPIPLGGLTDTTAIVSAVMRADNGKPPAMMFSATGFADSTKLAGALKAAGYKGIVLTPLYDPRLAGLDVLDDTYASLQWSVGLDKDVPAQVQLVKDMETYAKGTPLSLPATAGYWSADTIVRALQKAGRNLTNESFLTMMNNDYVNYVPGALAETRFPLNHIGPAPCGALVHLQNKKYTPTKLTCGTLLKPSA